MAEQLTSRQRAILDFIRDFLRRKGYPPSVREIGEAVGLSSSSTVHGHLARLEERGFIRRDPDKPRAIEVLGFGPVPAGRVAVVPLVGSVAAGAPILAEENVEDRFTLPWEFARGDDSFALRVKGDSMIDAGILDGDFVIVRRQATAENGDVVAALLGDEATIKRYYRETGHVRLQPENARLEPIIVREVAILGRVVGVLRKL